MSLTNLTIDRQRKLGCISSQGYNIELTQINLDDSLVRDVEASDQGWRQLRHSYVCTLKLPFPLSCPCPPDLAGGRHLLSAE